MSAEISNHIIVCGYSLLGQKIVKKLKEDNITYVAIEHDRNHVKMGHDVGDVVFFGNAASKIMLNFVGIKNAIAVIIAIDNDDKVRLITEAIKSININIEVIVKISHQAQIDDLIDLGVKSFVNENDIVASELVKKQQLAPCKSKHMLKHILYIIEPKLFTYFKKYGYGQNDFYKDLLASLSVAIVALPLSLAIAIASNLPPERGLFTAIVTGFLISFLVVADYKLVGQLQLLLLQSLW